MMRTIFPALVVSALYTLARAMISATPILLEEIVALIVPPIIFVNLQMKYLLISIIN
jgi:hypothetical protein